MRSAYAISAPQRSMEEIQKEINALSPEEKARIHKDVYGSDEHIIETDEIVTTGLEQMEWELQQTTTSDDNTTTNDPNIQYYIRAFEAAPDFVTDRGLRLQFLRCELFDAKKAAQRYIKYWKERIMLWGEHRAYKKITVDDFGEEDQVALLLGGYQFCTKLDHYRRGVMLGDRNRFDQRPSHRKCQLRQTWYMYEALLENEEVQKNGIVNLMGLNRTSLLEQDRKFDHMYIQVMIHAFPMRCVSIHHVVSSRMVQYIVPFVLYLLGSDLRARYKSHVYSCSIFDTLQTYGITRDMIPSYYGGTDDTYNYNEWLESRRLNNQ